MINVDKIDNIITRLKRIAMRSADNNVNLSMQAMDACSQILYSYNQYYVDDELEFLVGKVSDKLVIVPDDYYGKDNTVLFYDGFGFDLRGWAASFVRALVTDGYKLIYVTLDNQKEKIPHILSELKNNTVEYISIGNHVKAVCELNKIFIKYKPSVAFYYTTPFDVSAAVTFAAYENRVKRIQIDLTDHAYWLGRNSVDYFFVSRSVGARIEIYGRKINKDRIIRLDCSPYINQDEYNEPLPFDINKEKYVFSGGALYKTLGDKELLFYRTVEEILNSDKNIKFLYAGNGDDSEMKNLIEKYKNRVFLIGERPDFFKLMQNALFFLNTYPMFGGLMMRYSALAGKVPITLKHDDDADGVLLNQNELGIEFNDYGDYISAIHALVLDDDYRKEKEAILEGAVIDDVTFARNLKMLIEENRSEFPLDDDELQPIDTKKFREEYINRFDKFLLVQSIANRGNLGLIRYFPFYFIKRIANKVIGARK